MDEQQQKYLDFEVRLEPDLGGYRTQVTDSPAGRASTSFSLPFSDWELEEFLARMGQVSTEADVNQTLGQELQSFGWKLFNSAFGREVANCLRQSMVEADRQDAGLRIRLNLSNTPELAVLPWEYLYYPDLNSFLALYKSTIFERRLEIPVRVRPFATGLPLRALVVIASPRGYYGQFDPEQEWADLQQATQELSQYGLLVLERLESPTLAALQHQLQIGQYHFFHFIGHGDTEWQYGTGRVELEDGMVGGELLGRILSGHPSLRVALLSRGGENPPSRADSLSGCALGLMQAGVPTVAAMQFKPVVEAERVLLANYYAGLVGFGYGVDTALNEARKTVFAENFQQEWAAPAFYLGAPEGILFEFDAEGQARQRRYQATVLYRRAIEAMKAEDWEAAIVHMERVLQLYPSHPEVEKLLVYARQRQGWNTLYNEGLEHYEAGRWRNAQTIFLQLQKETPNYRRVSQLLAEINGKMAQSGQQQINEYYREADNAMALAEWEIAQARYQAVLELDPTQEDARHRLEQLLDWEKRYKLGVTQQETGQWKEALQWYSPIFEDAPDYKDVSERIAFIRGLFESNTIRSIVPQDWQSGAAGSSPVEINTQRREQLRQQQEWAALYNEGQENYASGRWDEALLRFQQLQQNPGAYRDVDRLINEIEAIAKAQKIAPSVPAKPVQSAEDYLEVVAARPHRKDRVKAMIFALTAVWSLVPLGFVIIILIRVLLKLPAFP